MKKVFIALMLAGLFAVSGSVFASASASASANSGDVVEHGGRTDSSGCHRDTKAGTRHCH